MTDMSVIEQTAYEYIKKLVLTSEPLMPRWNCENYIFRKKPKWNYMDNCMIRALLMFDNPEYTEYAAEFMDSYIDSDGVIATMRAADYNLDNICGGMNLIQLYQIIGSRHYRLAYEKLYNEQLAHQPRLKCGNFWHKAVYPEQLWIDGAYMALPFLASYGKINGNDSIVEDAVSQMLNIRKLMLDKKSGLYYHGYNESREMFWSDKKTGLSPEIWLRSDGWLCAGLADLYEITGDRRIGVMLRELIGALCRCLTFENMLMQLPLYPDMKGNYPETSGTLLFAYGAMKGFRLGVSEKSAAECGFSALSAVTDKYIVYRNGIPVLKNICLMGGLGGEKRRDGSAEYYLSERIVENEAKGIAPYLMAVYELLKLKN